MQWDPDKFPNCIGRSKVACGRLEAYFGVIGSLCKYELKFMHVPGNMDEKEFAIWRGTCTFLQQERFYMNIDITLFLRKNGKLLANIYV